MLYLLSKFRRIPRSRSHSTLDLSIMSTSTSTNVPLLTTANYSLWADAMEDYLRAKGYWFQIHTPPPTQIADPKGWRKCMEARDSAVGEIRQHLSPELRSVSLSSNDPQAILNAIKAAYGTSSFATRFNAMQAFLAVKQETSETVAVFISRAREALCLLQSTRPSASLVTPTGSGPSIRLGTRIGSSLSLSC